MIPVRLAPIILYEFLTFATLVRAIANAPRPSGALSQLMVVIRDLIPVEAGTLFRYEQATDELIFEVVLGPNADDLDQRRLSANRGIAGWVARRGEPLMTNDALADPRFHGMFDRDTGFQTHSVLCVPLIATGEVRGVLQLINRIDGPFTDRDLMLARIAATLGALLQLLADLGYGSWEA